MSLDLMSWAFKQEIEPPAKLVLLALKKKMGFE